MDTFQATIFSPAKHQSGFRSLHSTVTALLDATNEWYLNIDQGNTNAVVFLDLAKAFDTFLSNIYAQFSCD